MYISCTAEPCSEQSRGWLKNRYRSGKHVRLWKGCKGHACCTEGAQRLTYLSRCGAGRCCMHILAQCSLHTGAKPFSAQVSPILLSHICYSSEADGGRSEAGGVLGAHVPCIHCAHTCCIGAPQAAHQTNKAFDCSQSSARSCTCPPV